MMKHWYCHKGDFLRKNMYICNLLSSNGYNEIFKMNRKIAIFCGSSIPNNPEYSTAARELGALLAENGDTVVYGGSNLGLMGEISGAAMKNGGTVIAVIPTFFSETIINSQPVTELIRVKSMSERKEKMIAMCDIFVALPGGIGTLDEVLEVMVANQLKQTKNADGTPLPCGKPIYLFNPDGFFDPFFVQLDKMGENGFFRSGKRPEVNDVKSLEQLMSFING